MQLSVPADAELPCQQRGRHSQHASGRALDVGCYEEGLSKGDWAFGERGSKERKWAPKEADWILFGYVLDPPHAILSMSAVRQYSAACC